MAQPAVNPIARFIVRRIIQLSSGWVQQTPRPLDATVVHRSGPDALRLLLIGDGNAVGFGVLSHEVGLGGAIAGRVARTTGRGVDLVIDAEDGMTADDCLARLSNLELSKFDGVIVNIGLESTLRLGSLDAWRSEFTRVLSALQRAEVPAFVVAVPRSSDDGPVPEAVRRVIRRQATLVNDVTEAETAAASNAVFIDLETLAGKRFQDRSIRQYYDLIASQIAPTVSAGVAGSRRRATGQDEAARQRSLNRLHIIENEVDARFDSIVGAVKSTFAVPRAAITFIDEDRQLVRSAAGMERGVNPRATAFCDTTIRTDGLFVVEDARAEERFQEYPAVKAGRVVFYAGYPLETVEGYRVGALCIMDDHRRKFTSDDGVRLRDFALEAQRQLWAS